MPKRLALAVLAVVLAACGAAPPSSSPPAGSLAPGLLALPTVANLGDACAGVGLEHATLRGDRNDPRVAWLELEGFGRKEVLFPPGFGARFSPQLEVVDQSGRIVAREGTVIDGGCVTGSAEGGPLLVLWP